MNIHIEFSGALLKCIAQSLPLLSSSGGTQVRHIVSDETHMLHGGIFIHLRKERGEATGKSERQSPCCALGRLAAALTQQYICVDIQFALLQTKTCLHCAAYGGTAIKLCELLWSAFDYRTKYGMHCT